jgi:hypothetical protein
MHATKPKPVAVQVTPAQQPELTQTVSADVCTRRSSDIIMTTTSQRRSKGGLGHDAEGSGGYFWTQNRLPMTSKTLPLKLRIESHIHHISPPQQLSATLICFPTYYRPAVSKRATLMNNIHRRRHVDYYSKRLRPIRRGRNWMFLAFVCQV